ncbi:MAG: glycosyltransferase family 2 protein [Burkholderiales bacterium]|nr:glycosyltransferase family 2 protein [Phycisphaerae bacterium]
MRTLIAIPVFNERKYVDRVLRRVHDFHDQILCVDDCSTDGTGDLLAQRKDIHLIRHERNMGYGRSIIDSFDFAAANGFDWIITMDCDEQHEPEMLPTFLREIEKDASDIISGSRYTHVNAQDDIAPGDRQLINRTITAAVNDLFGWELTDTFCGFKAHRVSAMQKLKLDEPGYAFPLQLWPRVYAAGLTVTEIPVRRIYNDPNRTFGGTLDDAKIRLRHYLDVLKTELTRINHEGASSVDLITLDEPQACCDCSCG